jgi:uncharacterized protein (TIGR03067 family)
MQSFIIRPGGFVAATMLVATLGPALPGSGPKGDTGAELKKLQGLWQHIPGGMEHQDGEQIVRGPARDGPYFFVHGNKLIWLDQEGKPSREQETITLEPTADPKRIKFTKDGKDGKDGKEDVVREGIYRWVRLPGVLEGEAARDCLTIHVALEGKPVPRRFLEFNKPIKGVDGCEWLVSRGKLQGN